MTLRNIILTLAGLLLLGGIATAQLFTLPRVYDPDGNRASAVAAVLTNADGSLIPAGQATGVYNSSLPTMTNGARGDIQLGANGALLGSMIGSNGAMLSIANANADDVVVSTPALAARSVGFYYDGTNYDRLKGESGASYAIQKGTASLATAQVSVGTSSTLIAAARAGRSKITVVIGAANGCALGNSGVTTSTGLLLPAVAGTTFTLETSAALYGACTSTTTVSAAEQY